MSEKPAVLGGASIFNEYVNIVRPVLPVFEDIKESIQEIIESGMVTKGHHLQTFQKEMASYLGVKHAVAVSSCTAGLMLSLQGLKVTGDIVVPSFTFMATVSAVVWAGLRPIFVDVDAGTTNIDPASVEDAITPQTSAIIAVHNFGNPADIEILQDIADRHGLKLIFDAAHGFGSCYRGQQVGGFGNVEVFSLSPTKLVIAGEGGIVATNDDDLAWKIQIGREYGMSNYDSVFAGINSRLPELSALMGLHSLQMVEDAAQQRNRIVDFYHRELGRLPGIYFQKVHPEDRCSYKDFSIVLDNELFGLTRDELALALAEENIDVRKYYNPPVHQQMAYRTFSTSGDQLPTTELLAARSLSLPIWSCMDEETCQAICVAIARIYRYGAEVKTVLQSKIH